MARRDPPKALPKVEHGELPLATLLAGRADYNPRRISAAASRQLESSITSFGIVEPIVWNRQTSRVVGGHQRLGALERVFAGRIAGAPPIDVMFVDLDETRERVLNLRLHGGGEFDPAKLSDLLDDLEARGLDAERDLGFPKGELDRLEKTARAELAQLPDSGEVSSPATEPALPPGRDARPRCPVCHHPIGAALAKALASGPGKRGGSGE